MNPQDALILDARIATYFFGLVATGESYEYARYSTDWNDMACVVEELRKRGWLVKMQEMPDNIPWVPSAPAASIYQKAYAELSFIRGRASTDPQETRRYIQCHIYALAATMPEAVCQAALKTLTADTEG